MSTTDSPTDTGQSSTKRLATRGKRLAKRLQNSALGRAFERFTEYNGNILAGGIAYYSLASIAAGIVLAVSIANFVLIGNDELRDAVFDTISETVPGVLDEGDGDSGIVDPASIQPTSFGGVLGIVAFGVLVFTATRYLRGLRSAVRSMLGGAAGTSIPGMLRDLIVLLGLVAIAAVGAVVQIMGGALASWVADLIGSQGVSEALVRGVSIATGLLVNALFIALVFVVLGGAQVRKKTLVFTVAVAAVAFTVLQQGSGYFVGSSADNAVLAPFAAVIALLVFVDFTARILLIGSAWLGIKAEGLQGVAVEELDSPARRDSGGVTTTKGIARVRGKD